jgi:hypothetical protein
MDELKLIIETAAEGTPEEEAEKAATEARKALVRQWQSRIRSAKGHHKEAFNRMRKDMDLAYHGYDPELWDDKRYVVNLCQRHVQQRTAALYAKNPRSVAKPRDRMLYKVWDGQPETIAMAKQIEQMALDNMQPVPQAVAELLADYGSAMEMRKQLERICKTMEILFHYFMQESQPSFKSQMKALVRRMLTTGVGFVKLGFQRQMARRPEITARMNDVTARLQYLERLTEEMGKGKHDEHSAQVEELRLSLKDLAEQENVIVREGLVFDFPDSTAIIVDPRCKQLRGFVGARWIAHEMMLSVNEVKEIYGKDLSKSSMPYTVGGKSHDSSRATMTSDSRKDEEAVVDGEQMVCIHEVYDKASGMVLAIAEGCDDFLKEPASPEITIEGFWPVFTLVCNEVEHEKEIYPPSDVHLIRSQAHTYNQLREGLREHRRANRPRYVTPSGKLEDEDKTKLQAANAHDVIELSGLAPGEKVEDILAPVKMAGIDPNLYEVGTVFDDVQLAVGAQEAHFGGTAGATATETSVAESARTSALGAQIDELDTFMSEVARASGAILLQQMSREKVIEIAGPGAVWPELSAQEIADEVFLEIEAGSTGKPNQAAELRNMERVLPYLIQIPGISPRWLAKEVLKRMDDKLDVDSALADGMGSIVSMNGQADANAAMGASQGPAGSMNAPTPQSPGMGPTGPAAQPGVM